MSTIRRKLLTRILERVAVGLVLLDLVLYLAAVRPLDTLTRNEWNRMTATRQHVQKLENEVARLEDYQRDLPRTLKQIQAFQHDHVPPRRRGFSRAARLVRQLTEQSGLQLAGVAYKLNPAKNDPLERMGIEVNVAGPYPNLLKFSHALETSSDLILLRDFTFSPIEAGGLELRLTADLYLLP
ncbi:MAG TPA: type 4a pilus biogenesis protein PilO [Terriglobia bacterium]|jgi:Tfp pilus assembly protein PilO|nr:type 4a pilus biogenesis protein PilO [Terriglobia bacterium]